MFIVDGPRPRIPIMVVLRGRSNKACVLIAIKVVDGLTNGLPTRQAPREIVLIRPIDAACLHLWMERPAMLAGFINIENHADATACVVLRMNKKRVVALHT